MKKLILFIAFILSVNLLFAQEREVDATVVIVRDSVIMTDGKVTDMAPGTALKDAVNTSQLTDTINKYAFVQPIDSLFFDRDAAITGHNPYKVDVDTTNGTLRMYNDEVDIAMQMGQELWIKVKNNNGSTFDDGIIVYISGSETGFPVVSIAHNRDFETCDAIGMLTHDVEAATFGYLTTYGTVGGLDTSGETEGARVYVDTLNGGKNWTTTIPEFAEFQYEIGFIHTADPTEGKIFINPKGQLDDIMHNINNANILENFDFRCASDGATISGILNSTDGKDYLTVRWSDGFSKISVPDTVTIPQGTDNNSQTAYIYIPKSTEVLTTSTSYFPIGTQYKTIAKTNAWSAARTQTVGLKGNQNYNDYVASITSLRGRIAQIGNWQRLRNLKYINGSNGTVTVRTGVAIPDTVTFAVTQGNWSQVNEQVLLAMDMYTGDSIHVLNYLSHADTAVIDLNELLVDANGTSLSGKSFTFVFWISQNKTGEPSHMWVNLPNGSYSSGAEAEADVNNYKVTEIPYNMRSYSGFVTEVVLTHTNPSGGTWSVYSTSNIQGNEPGYSGGGAGGPTGGTIDGLSDTPSGKGGSANKIFAVDNLEANLEYKDVTIDASGNMVAAGTITSPNFISNVAIGTQSYAGISTTLNINLNADLLDGVQGANYFNKLTDDTDDITEGSNLFNQTHTGEVSGSIALTIANNIIDEPNLKVTNTPTDDFLLSYDIGTLGFTWVPPFGDVSFSDTVSIIATKYDIDTVSISVALNTTHRTSNGTDHSYIDQSVISGATPTFTNANFTEATDKNYVTDA
ncbi:hypothetical protein KAR91_25470, partial [Candidatus Pacearchaeota archaeon]|nr:hypothetical protein [Candidatus Pacearchaeota archaeon]